MKPTKMGRPSYHAPDDRHRGSGAYAIVFERDGLWYYRGKASDGVSFGGFASREAPEEVRTGAQGVANSRSISEAPSSEGNAKYALENGPIRDLSGGYFDSGMKPGCPFFLAVPDLASKRPVALGRLMKKS